MLSLGKPPSLLSLDREGDALRGERRLLPWDQMLYVISILLILVLWFCIYNCLCVKIIDWTVSVYYNFERQAAVLFRNRPPFFSLFFCCEFKKKNRLENNYPEKLKLLRMRRTNAMLIAHNFNLPHNKEQPIPYEGSVR